MIIAHMFLVLLMAIPMGKIGDKYGRGKIMALSLVGVGGWLCEIFVVCMYQPQYEVVISDIL
jgi:MFS family permease